MKHATLGVAFIVPLALLLSGCAGLAGYFSPAVQADQVAVEADTVLVNNDLLAAKTDFVTNKAALPADATKLVADQVMLAAAFNQWVTDLKAAGKPAPPTPPVINATVPGA